MEQTSHLIIGGGIVGAALAYGLARAGERVTLLDEGDVALRAARGNFGNVWVQGKGAMHPEYADLTRRTAHQWATFAKTLEDETGADLHFRRPGAYFLCFSAEELERRAATMAKANEQAVEPCDFEVLRHAELKQRLPELGPDVYGATWCTADGTANPLFLLRALIKAFVGFGGQYRPHQAVLTVARDGEGFRADTADAVYRADAVMLTAGLSNARLAPQLGLSAPVRPVRGQIMVTEKVRPFLKVGTNFIRQTLEGGCVFGESSEEAGTDEGTTLPILAETAHKAVLAFPLLKDVQVVRAWSALRIMTADGSPVYQQAADGSRAFVLSVHSGVTLAPFHAGDMARAVLSGALDAERFHSFSAERFHVRTA